MLSRSLFALAVFGQSIVAQSNSTTNPCALVAQLVSAQIQKGAKLGLIKPSEAVACLNDVPINATIAAAQVDWLSSYLQFQSTLPLLKNPPSTYPFPPVDVLGGLASIKTKALGNGYKGEFEFESAILTLLLSTYDGHLSYTPPLWSLFGFLTTFTLVSVSKDGTALPKIYNKDDLNQTNPPSIDKINGIDAATYVTSLARTFQDYDALYNSMFFSPLNTIAGNQVSYATPSFGQPLNDTTSYTFSNGSVINVNNLAGTSTFSAQSGSEIYDKYVIQKTPTTSSPASSSAASSASPSSATNTPLSSDPRDLNSKYYTSLGLPAPILATNDHSAAAFVLPDAPDTVVLSIQGFFGSIEGPFTHANPTLLQWQNLVKELLASARQSGKTKLIIDVRGNRGGTIYTAYELFKQLFPDKVPFSATRFRAHPAANALGTVISRLGPPSLDNATLLAATSEDWNYQTNLKSPDGPAYSSWQELYGPVNVSGGQFSNIHSWKFSDANLDIASTGFVVSGYANNTSIAPSPFAASNITLLTDGACSSTCTILGNLLLTQNVNTLTIGGRPNNQPMALIGGVQGNEELGFDTINNLATIAAQNAPGEDAISSVLQPLLAKAPYPYPAGSAPSLNFKDGMTPGNNQTPLQFLPPTKAKCRIFYTLQDVTNATYTWDRIAQGKYSCVANGTQTGTQGGSSNSAASVTLSNMPKLVSAAILTVIVALLL